MFTKATPVSHPSNVFGVAWNPFQENAFATACEDGTLRLWSLNQSNI